MKYKMKHIRRISPEVAKVLSERKVENPMNRPDNAVRKKLSLKRFNEICSWFGIRKDTTAGGSPKNGS